MVRQVLRGVPRQPAQRAARRRARGARAPAARAAHARRHAHQPRGGRRQVLYICISIRATARCRHGGASERTLKRADDTDLQATVQ